MTGGEGGVWDGSVDSERAVCRVWEDKDWAADSEAGCGAASKAERGRDVEVRGAVTDAKHASVDEDDRAEQHA